ncbi:MAG TPA: hypothetical protein VK587_03565 [bacterium]|nr:hypothetical protein [bacterium]
MVTTRDIERYRQVIQEAVADLGARTWGSATFGSPSTACSPSSSDGAPTRDVLEVPVDALQNRESAHQAVMKAIRPLSKAVEEQDKMRKA